MYAMMSLLFMCICGNCLFTRPLYTYHRTRHDLSELGTGYRVRGDQKLQKLANKSAG